jgi:hypothetical protein
MGRRARLAAILLYIALDLSLPSMPGAFEFDPAASVEGAQSARPRVTAEIAVAPVPPGSPFAVTPPAATVPRRTVPVWTGPPPAVAPTALRRMPVDGPLSSTDPH